MNIAFAIVEIEAFVIYPGGSGLFFRFNFSAQHVNYISVGFGQSTEIDARVDFLFYLLFVYQVYSGNVERHDYCVQSKINLTFSIIGLFCFLFFFVNKYTAEVKCKVNNTKKK